jgi:hypothetical protein
MKRERKRKKEEDEEEKERANAENYTMHKLCNIKHISSLQK